MSAHWIPRFRPELDFELPLPASAPHDAPRSPGEVLGLLASDDDETRRLRDVVRCYLASGCSVSATSRAMRENPSSVRAAIAHAEDLLGHDVVHGMLELRIALEWVAHEQRTVTRAEAA